MRDRPTLLAVACGVLAAAAVALALVMLLSAREDPPRPFTWPTIVRTVDGVPTTVQPEDLNR